jgi:very-short-patch-repair endonuclease
MQRQPTRHALALAEELQKRGVQLEMEYWDGHKHVDIYIPAAKICIEINGLQHYTNPEQIAADLQRAHFSDGDGRRTMTITNQLIDSRLSEIADAIGQIARA